MMHKAKVAVPTKPLMQNERHVQCSNVKPGGTQRNRQALKR
jgi:hypothetical protein